MLKARIITDSESIERGTDCLYISEARTDNAYLAYIDSKNNVEIRVGIGKLNKDRSIYCSELLKKVKNSDWFRHKRLVVDGALDDFDIKLLSSDIKSPQPEYYIIESDLGDLVPINTPDELGVFEFNNIWGSIFNDINPDLAAQWETQINDMLESNEIYLYNSSKGIINILESSREVNLVENKSDIYTDTLDLRSIFFGETLSEDIKNKIDLSIQYTILGDKKIYSTDICFSGFFFKNSKLVSNDFIRKINEDIIVEYLNGIIRVIPNSDKVLECIINNCTITYGNLGKQ